MDSLWKNGTEVKMKRIDVSFWTGYLNPCIGIEYMYTILGYRTLQVELCTASYLAAAISWELDLPMTSVFHALRGGLLEHIVQT